MVKKAILNLFLVLLVGSVAFGQKKAKIAPADLAQLKEHEDTLALLSYMVLHDSSQENRFLSCRALIKSLVRTLKTPNSFHYPFQGLQSVSIQYPADSTFRIFTWQLYVDKDDYRYFGAIQMNTPDLQLFPLIDRSFEVKNIEQDQLSPDQWYGSLYYNIKQVNNKETGPYYLLFGYDGYTFFRKRKVIDVLSFQQGKPVFGAPVFVHKEGPQKGLVKKRVMLEYSSETNVRLNYDDALGLIIFDHLMEMGGQYNEGPVKVSDGTYEGYRIKDGYCVYVEKIFDTVMDEAPRPFPILDQRDKDLFGGKGKN